MIVCQWNICVQSIWAYADAFLSMAECKTPITQHRGNRFWSLPNCWNMLKLLLQALDHFSTKNPTHCLKFQWYMAHEIAHFSSILKMYKSRTLLQQVSQILLQGNGHPKISSLDLLLHNNDKKLSSNVHLVLKERGGTDKVPNLIVYIWLQLR